MLHHDLGRTEHMPCRNETHLHLAQPHDFAILDRPARLRSITAFHDCQSLGSRKHLRMSASGVVGMAVSDERPSLRLTRVDPGVCGLDVNAFGKRLYPGTETGHRGLRA